MPSGSEESSNRFKSTANLASASIRSCVVLCCISSRPSCVPLARIVVISRFCYNPIEGVNFLENVQLSSVEAAILRFVNERQYVDQMEILRAFADQMDYCKSEDLVRYLLSEKCLDSDHVSPKNGIHITPFGVHSLSAFDDEQMRIVDAKHQRKIDNRFKVISIVAPIVTFLLGLFVDHYTDVVGFLLRFLGL